MTQEEIIKRANEAVTKSYKDGAEYMLERVLNYLQVEHPTFFEHFVEEIRKAMEE
jgi:hypothetical protein